MEILIATFNRKGVDIGTYVLDWGVIEAGEEVIRCTYLLDRSFELQVVMMGSVP